MLVYLCWTIGAVVLLGVLLVAYVSIPSSGRHAGTSVHRKVEKTLLADAMEYPAVRGELYGVSDLISGYAVGADGESYYYRAVVGPLNTRPYVRHVWCQVINDPEQATDLALFNWRDDGKGELPPVPILVAA
jgi:hypothetical protein